MKTIQIVVDSDLLRLADRSAKKLKTNRSALFREALRAHLNRLDVQQKETQDRDGYLRCPDSLDDPAAWDKVTDWPDGRRSTGRDLNALLPAVRLSAVTLGKLDDLIAARRRGRAKTPKL